MKTLNEITNGYQSTYERMDTMAVACRLNTAACCGNEVDRLCGYTEDDRYKEFCDCVHCILCGYVVSGSFTAAEIPCDVSILHWVNAQGYVIDWFNDHNDPDDDFDSDEDMMYEDGSTHFTTKDMEAEYDHTDDSIDVDTEPTEDMMYPDGSSYFTTKDMEAEYDRDVVSCKDCPDDECTGHCMSCCYR